MPKHVARQAVPRDYAVLLAHGWDTVEETFLWRMAPGAEDRLDAVKAEAKTQSPNDDGLVSFGFAGEQVQMSAYAPRGVTWLFGNDDLLFKIRRGAAGTATVRYTAAGLWEHGLAALRQRATQALTAAGRPTRNDWRRATRADFAFDFWSPGFSREMVPGIANAVVMNAKCKVRTNGKVDDGAVCEVGNRLRTETLTLGAAGWLQVQVYDKLREIREASGKTWMLALWEREGFCPPDGAADVWRVECRWWKDFLRERRITTVDELEAARGQLVAESLHTRRLATPTADTNRRRWPLHPLWQIAQDAAGASTMRPIGRRVTGARAAVVERTHRQIAGTVIAAIVAQTEGFDLAAAGPVFERIEDIIRYDPDLRRKITRNVERYELLDEAR